jgi:5-methylcytosine-specific restriction endonuclease McrA
VHSHKDKVANDQRRGSSVERGYDSVWNRVRKIKADLSPLCESCLIKNIERPMNVVHHIKTIEQYPELRLVLQNLLSLCTPCHEKIHGPDRYKTKPPLGVPR